MKHLVTIIIPAYNSSQSIDRAIESVIHQTYADWELIVVDDCSKDETKEIVAKYVNDPRIKRIDLEFNSGRPAVPRNAGITQANGELIAFLDADDEWLADKLEKQTQYFNDSTVVGVACRANLTIKTPHHRAAKVKNNRLGYIECGYESILNANQIITSSVIVKREILEKAGYFDEDKVFSFIEDWELWLRMARFGYFRILDEKLVNYTVARKRGQQAMEISKNSLQIFQKHLDLGYVDEPDLAEPTASAYLSIARNSLEFDAGKSRKYYFKAFCATSELRKKIKSVVGLFVALLPAYLKKSALDILYRIDKNINK